MRYSFGFIGAGNMGSALAISVCKKVDPATVAITDADTAKATALAETLSAVCTDTADIIGDSDYIFIAVKPQTLPALFAEIAPLLAARKSAPVLVTMAAGTSIAKLLSMAGKDYPTIRIMPNTPVACGCGMTLYTKNALVSDEALNAFLSAMEHSGKLLPVAEEKFDAESIVTGCGPAYVFLFIEGMAKAAESLGASPEAARLYAEQTVLGAATLALTTGRDPAALREAVCSPGGTTIEGIKSFFADGLCDSVVKAAQASYARTLELLGGK